MCLCFLTKPKKFNGGKNLESWDRLFQTCRRRFTNQRFKPPTLGRDCPKPAAVHAAQLDPFALRRVGVYTHLKAKLLDTTRSD